VGPKGERRRRQFLQAALELFSTQGYEATTTRAVAEAAGAGESLLFRYFPSKQELFRAVVAEHGPGALFAFPADDPAPTDFGEALGAFVRSYLNTLHAHRRWFSVLHREAQRDPEAQREVREQYRLVGDALRGLLQYWVERREIRADAVPAALQVISLATRGFVARVARSEPEDWETERDAFIANLMDVVAYGILVETRRGR